MSRSGGSLPTGRSRGGVGGGGRPTRDAVRTSSGGALTSAPALVPAGLLLAGLLEGRAHGRAHRLVGGAGQGALQVGQVLARAQLLARRVGDDEGHAQVVRQVGARVRQVGVGQVYAAQDSHCVGEGVQDGAVGERAALGGSSAGGVGWRGRARCDCSRVTRRAGERVGRGRRVRARLRRCARRARVGRLARARSRVTPSADDRAGRGIRARLRRCARRARAGRLARARSRRGLLCGGLLRALLGGLCGRIARRDSARGRAPRGQAAHRGIQAQGVRLVACRLAPAALR